MGIIMVVIIICYFICEEFLIYQVFFGHGAQCLRSGTLNLVKSGNLITATHSICILPLLYSSQVHVSGIEDTEEERIKEAAAYIAQRNLLASEEGRTTSKRSTASKQSTSTLHQEEIFEKKSRKVAIREKAERLSLRKTVRKDNLISFTKVEMHVTCMCMCKLICFK